MRQYCRVLCVVLLVGSACRLVKRLVRRFSGTPLTKTPLPTRFA